ncbi:MULTISPECIES: hypothetical protein [Bacillus cereus group]|uniref:hypothetical protein n=1 Tax=Bacillus cereus group TaxID=86661 RepID=UPI000EA215F3|nr:MULTISPECIES: hypothetical protein [Bacillus cereus group]MDF9530162.1 hypothetical protein [Bacillus cereus]MDG1578432.1 hypothetical protein [Bacillus cereus]RKI20211.1 hypothetical protein D7V71_28215 [Bacillus thuringiensis]HDR4483480.1 hypothetical protein [Bacillus cereus]
MVKSIFLLDEYLANKLDLQELIDIMYTSGVNSYHSRDEDILSLSVNECIKTIQVATDMRKEIKKFIDKFLIINGEITRVRFFPLDLDAMDPLLEDLPLLEKIEAELENDIFYELLTCIDGEDKEKFFVLCSDWEKTCINMWKIRIEEVNDAFDTAMLSFQ